jgi:hypothetical protein
VATELELDLEELALELEATELLELEATETATEELTATELLELEAGT